MKTNTNKSTVEQGLDPKSQQYVDQQRAAAQEQYKKFLEQFSGPYGGSFSPEFSPYLDQAGAGYGGYAQAGQRGLLALQGDPEALKGFGSDISMLDPVFERSSNLALKAAADRSAGAGAFGSRADLLRGTLLGNVAMQRNQLGYQAAQDARQRALATAGLGLQGLGGQTGIGQYMTDANRQALMAKYQDFLRQQGIPAEALSLLGLGLGPTGTTQTNTTQTQSSPLLQLGGLLLPFLGKYFNQQQGTPYGGQF